MTEQRTNLVEGKNAELRDLLKELKNATNNKVNAVNGDPNLEDYFNPMSSAHKEHSIAQLLADRTSYHQVPDGYFVQVQVSPELFAKLSRGTSELKPFTQLDDEGKSYLNLEPRIIAGQKVVPQLQLQGQTAEIVKTYLALGLFYPDKPEGKINWRVLHYRESWDDVLDIQLKKSELIPS